MNNHRLIGLVILVIVSILLGAPAEATAQLGEIKKDPHATVVSAKKAISLKLYKTRPEHTFCIITQTAGLKQALTHAETGPLPAI